MRYMHISRSINNTTATIALAVSLALTLTACAQPVSRTPSDGLTRFGATVNAWNAHHTEDTDFAPGSVYDPDPALPQINGHTGAIYVEVTTQNGRVMNYVINTLGLTVHAAITRAKKELPPDAYELWGAKRDTCYQAELVSPTLGRALATASVGDPNGDVFVELDTVLQNGNSVYESNNVNQIMLSNQYYPTAAAAAVAGSC